MPTFRNRGQPDVLTYMWPKARKDDVEFHPAQAARNPQRNNGMNSWHRVAWKKANRHRMACKDSKNRVVRDSPLTLCGLNPLMVPTKSCSPMSAST
eukprot:3797362-Amphidinium_carterae.2